MYKLVLLVEYDMSERLDEECLVATPTPVLSEKPIKVVRQILKDFASLTAERLNNPLGNGMPVDFDCDFGLPSVDNYFFVNFDVARKKWYPSPPSVMTLDEWFDARKELKN